MFINTESRTLERKPLDLSQYEVLGKQDRPGQVRLVGTEVQPMRGENFVTAQPTPAVQPPGQPPAQATPATPTQAPQAETHPAGAQMDNYAAQYPGVPAEVFRFVKTPEEARVVAQAWAAPLQAAQPLMDYQQAGYPDERSYLEARLAKANAKPAPQGTWNVEGPGGMQIARPQAPAPGTAIMTDAAGNQVQPADRWMPEAAPSDVATNSAGAKAWQDKVAFERKTATNARFKAAGQTVPYPEVEPVAPAPMELPTSVLSNDIEPGVGEAAQKAPIIRGLETRLATHVKNYEKASPKGKQQIGQQIQKLQQDATERVSMVRQAYLAKVHEKQMKDAATDAEHKQKIEDAKALTDARARKDANAGTGKKMAADAWNAFNEKDYERAVTIAQKALTELAEDLTPGTTASLNNIGTKVRAVQIADAKAKNAAMKAEASKLVAAKQTEIGVQLRKVSELREESATSKETVEAEKALKTMLDELVGLRNAEADAYATVPKVADPIVAKPVAADVVTPNLAPPQGQAAPSARPAQAPWGLRRDGTPKGNGFFGPLTMNDGSGKMATELSIGVDFDGHETEIPTLVPTLSNEERQYLLAGNDPRRNPAIMRKAVDHARQRMSSGRSPFAAASDIAAQPSQGTQAQPAQAPQPTAPAKPTPQVKLPVVNTDADWNALPSGTEFVDGQGRKWRKN